MCAWVTQRRNWVDCWANKLQNCARVGLDELLEKFTFLPIRLILLLYVSWKLYEKMVYSAKINEFSSRTNVYFVLYSISSMKYIYIVNQERTYKDSSSRSSRKSGRGFGLDFIASRLSSQNDTCHWNTINLYPRSQNLVLWCRLGLSKWSLANHCNGNGVRNKFYRIRTSSNLKTLIWLMVSACYLCLDKLRRSPPDIDSKWSPSRL